MTTHYYGDDRSPDPLRPDVPPDQYGDVAAALHWLAARLDTLGVAGDPAFRRGAEDAQRLLDLLPLMTGVEGPTEASEPTRQAGYAIGPGGRPMCPGVVCRCPAMPCPMHGTKPAAEYKGAGVTVFRDDPARPPTVRFEMDLSPYLSHQQRLDDFLAGAGAVVAPLWNFLVIVTMPLSALQRWQRFVTDIATTPVRESEA